VERCSTEPDTLLRREVTREPLPDIRWQTANHGERHQAKEAAQSPERIVLRYGNPARKDDEADDTDAHPPLTAGTEVRHDGHEITVSRTTRSRRLKLRQPWNPGAPEEVSQS